MSRYLMSIDQGTTSSRAIIFDATGNVISTSQKPFKQFYPQEGWVEHKPGTIWSDVVSVCNDAMFRKKITASDIAAIGITNQRETTVVWNRETGKTVHFAIVWQDRRTAEQCRQLKAEGHEPTIQAKTGLLLDPYFSATKIAWILDNVDGAREQAEQGKLAFGTIDTFLLWRLTGGQVHATDATNASRTMLFNIHTQQWDEELLDLFAIPKSMLPAVKDSSDDFGVTQAELFGGEIPIYGIAGDQQAALFGQTCFTPGMMKSTYGTGGFMMLNTGDTPLQSQNRLLTTVGYRLNGKPTYALEGSIFIAGAVMQWLRDQLQVVRESSDSEALAKSVDDTNGVYFVPAFTGLGAPYWQPDARGMITGLTRDSSIAHIVRAGLESVCYRTRDLWEAMVKDGAKDIAAIRVDGGMVANNWECQFLADMLHTNVERPTIIETTALGVAYLAGSQAGMFGSLADIQDQWQRQAVFAPSKTEQETQALYDGWQKAIRQVLAS